MAKSVWALGLMSGTSLDGIDAALIRTDGRFVQEFGAAITQPLDESLRESIQGICRGEGDAHAIEAELTEAHIEVVKALLKEADMKRGDVEVIGFHGQTIMHRPKDGLSQQLGNGALMAEKTKIDTVCDFRRRDIAAGGEGAPLVPLFHAALVRDMELPVAVLNIGGVANVTWIGRSEYIRESLVAHDIFAFDTGMGNGLIDEFVEKRRGLQFDDNGKLAAQGTVHENIIKEYLEHPYFTKHPPKSLDRYDFTLDKVAGLSDEDGAATLTALTAESVARSAEHFPVPVKKWLVAGGGRLNSVLMDEIGKRLKHHNKVDPVEVEGWDGDALEAQAFGFLAVRAINRLPLTLPTTTGTNHAVTGGAFYPA